jgi:hypothetical protein
LISVNGSKPRAGAQARGGTSILRQALIASTAFAFLATLAEPADAARKSKQRYVASKSKRDEPIKQPFGDLPKGPLQLVVSVGQQRVTLFANGVPVGHARVSSGTASNPTPMGVFSIIQKNRHHRSNIYSNAPMPYMQRLTWSGIALHEGALPGYPASHGCIRLPQEFAARLWAVTKLGMRVVVATEEVAPRDIVHPTLFAPKPKPAEPVAPTAPAAPEVAATEERVKVADAAASPMASRSDAVAGPTAKAAESGPGEAPQTMAMAETPKPDAAATPNADPAKPEKAPQAAAKPKFTPKGQVAVFVSRKDQKLYVRQGFTPLFDTAVTIEQPNEPLGTHVFTALEFTHNGTGMRWNVITMPNELPRGANSTATRSRSASRKAPEPAPKHAAEPPPAAEVLSRLKIPQDAVDRIEQLLVPGSSLVISDQGLGNETGRGTEFIVVTRK